MQPRWIVALALAGCPGQRSHPTLAAHVVDEAGAPVADATVAAVCERGGNGAAARTGADGLARLVLFFDNGAPCVVTVSHPGFDPVQERDVRSCAGGAACDPLEVVLGGVPR